ncbi:MAG: hypothetical protein ACREBU_04160 [Nitrososphaera sp.]
MPRVNLTISDDNYQYLKRMKDSGRAASLSHAVRITILEYRQRHEGRGRKRNE